MKKRIGALLLTICMVAAYMPMLAVTSFAVKDPEGPPKENKATIKICVEKDGTFAVDETTTANIATNKKWNDDQNKNPVKNAVETKYYKLIDESQYYTAETCAINKKLDMTKNAVADSTIYVKAKKFEVTFQLDGTGSVVYPTTTIGVNTVKWGDKAVTKTEKGTPEELWYTVVCSDNTDVTDQAKVTVTVKKNDTVLGSATKNYKITKPVGTITAPTANTLTYNGDAEGQVLVTAGSSEHGTVVYGIGTSTTEPESYTDELTDIVGVDAGDYYVWYKLNPDTDHVAPAADKVMVTIAKATLTADWAEGTPDLTYDGEQQKPAVEVMFGSSALTEDTDYTVSYDNNTDATTASSKATATITLYSNSNWGFGGGFDVTKTLSFDIAKATLNLVASAEDGVCGVGAETGYTYDEDFTGIFTESFSAGGEACAEPTTAGTYTYTVSTEGDDNYEAASDEATFEIKHKVAKYVIGGETGDSILAMCDCEHVMAVIAVVGASKPYDGKPADIKVIDAKGDGYDEDLDGTWKEITGEEFPEIHYFDKETENELEEPFAEGSYIAKITAQLGDQDAVTAACEYEITEAEEPIIEDDDDEEIVDGVKTGDANGLMIYLMMSVAAMAGAAYVYKRKEN